MDFASCAAGGRYDHVPAAERCTIGVAQRIGVYDSEAWFADSYVNTTRTQAEDAVGAAADAGKPSMLCAPASSPALAHVAYPLCGVAVGPASALAEKPDGSAECVTSECPPMFGRDGASCTRPSVPKSVAQTARCDERWYDWFNVENAHLGNGVRQHDAGDGAGAQCYAPCPAGFVPNAAADPADGTPVSLSAKDDPATCVPKTDFFFGAYANTPDYAPLAWIYRLTTRPEDFVKNVEAAVAALDVSGSLAPDAMKNARQAATASAGDVYTAMDAATRDISGAKAMSMNARYLKASKTLNTDERLRYALTVAQRVRDDPAGAKRVWGAGWGDRANERLALLKTACHLVCCDANNMASIGAKPICFDAADLAPAAAAKADKASRAAAAADAKRKKNEDDLAARGVGTPGELAFYRSLRPTVWLIVLPMAAVVLWVVAWPIVNYVYRAMFGTTDASVGTKEGLEIKVLNNMLWSDFITAWTSIPTFVAGKAEVVAGKLYEGLGEFMKGINEKGFGTVLQGVSFVIVLFAVFAIILFIYFAVHVNDIRFSQSGGFYRGMESFFNAFNWNDWIIFNWRMWWPVRVANEFMNPYRRVLSPEAIRRGLLPAGRCDGVAWLPDGAGRCASSLRPAPIEWTLSFPEGARVPSVLRTSAPTTATIPYVEDGDRFVASCDVKVGDRALLAPVAGDANSCALVHTPLDAYTDAFRPKRGATAWAGLDGFADKDTPRC